MVETDRIVMEDDVAVVSFGRPERANALRREDKAAVAATIASITAADARAIVLTGLPSRAFCAGSDIDQMSTFGAEEMREMLEHERALFESILRSPLPVVGAVNGAAMGAGFITAMCCDHLVASDQATFALPELGIGVSIPLHGFLLPFITGLTRARAMYYLQTRIDAATALEQGIVSEVQPADEHFEIAKERARRMGRIEGGAFRIQKRLLNHTLLANLVDDVVEVSMAESSVPFASGGPGERMRAVRSVRKEA
jgi:enoyl-CoA hydratase/carnithine racemase